MSRVELPALLGGSPVFPDGPPSWPVPDEDVRDALQAAYSDSSWGKYHGGAVERLEEELARYHGVAYAITCASGTFAVELALRALKVSAGDAVVLAAYDYGGNFLNVHAVGAHPVLVDVAAENWNLNPALLKEALSPATKAVIASHLHGGMVPMREVMEFAGEHGLQIIEDAAQMPGASIEDRSAGTWADVGVLSFGGSKLLTAGRGGALLTNRTDVHQRARVLLHRGNVLAPLSELQAAVLLPQLQKLDARNAIRARHVEVLQQRLSAVPGLRTFRNPTPAARPGYYKLGFQLDEAEFGLSRERFLAAIRAEGIAFDEGFKALHVGRSPNRFRAGGELREASRAHMGAVVLHHPVLLGSEADIETVAAAICKVHAYREQLR